MQRDYISDPMYTFESANHASKACGPLVLWAIAQVNYQLSVYNYYLLKYSVISLCSSNSKTIVFLKGTCQ